jgi:hypothetical protein
VLLYRPVLYRSAMATAKTGSFYLTETISLPASSADGTRVQGTIDLSSYVNVPTGQAIAIDQFDVIHQVGNLFSTTVQDMVAADASLNTQCTDLNPGTVFVRADSLNLVGSSSLNIDQGNNVATHVADIYPDNYGPSNLSEMFLCVNDTLYVVSGNDGAAVGGSAVHITVRLRCRVVKLSSKDWMSLAIQATAES